MDAEEQQQRHYKSGCHELINLALYRDALLIKARGRSDQPIHPSSGEIVVYHSSILYRNSWQNGVINF